MCGHHPAGRGRGERDPAANGDPRLDASRHAGAHLRAPAAFGDPDDGRAQLLDEIWGNSVYVEERTVDVHIRRLRQALEPTGHKALLETVRGVGYCFRRDLPPETPAFMGSMLNSEQVARAALGA